MKHGHASGGKAQLEQSSKLEGYYQLWIRNIAVDVKRKYCVGILEHIRKHVIADCQKHFEAGENADWRGWSASLHNLLNIFDAVYLKDNPPTIDEKLAKLKRHYERHPEKRTPPPLVKDW